MKRKFLYRLYFYFRRGYTTYLALLISFLNFIVIQYRLLIEEIPILKSIFYNIILFVIFVGISIALLSILIGWWDMKRGSFPEEARISWENNPEYKWLKEKIVEIDKKINDIYNKIR